MIRSSGGSGAVGEMTRLISGAFKQVREAVGIPQLPAGDAESK